MRSLLAWVLWACVALTQAHPGNIPAAKAKVGVDGSVEMKVRFDILAFVCDATPLDVADEPMNELLDGASTELQSRLNEARGRLERTLKLLGDGQMGAIASIDFPTAEEVIDTAKRNGEQRLPVMLTAIVQGHLPKGAKKVAFGFPAVLGDVVLTTEFPYQEPISEPVSAGSVSTALNIPTAQQVAAAAAAMQSRRPVLITEKPVKDTAPPIVLKPTPIAKKPKEEPKKEKAPPVVVEATKPPVATAPAIESPLPPQAAPQQQGPSWVSSFGGYLKMGFLHILPEGLDHILFVLGLFLLSTKTKDLLKQITAFTVAHSLTLGLSLYGVVRLPSSIIEPIIAISIAFIAIENIFTTEMKAWRPLVVFGFGLVHGLGFAGALQDAGLAKANFLTALLGFNLGVEGGQLAVVAGAFLLVGWFRSNQRYRRFVTIPASMAIATMAIVWTFERIL